MTLLTRGASFAVLAILTGIALQAGVFAIASWTLEDMHVYLEAARRLRAGGELYSTTNPLAAYQYAPWFATAWIPLTFLPEALVSVLWSALLVAGSLVSVWPLLRRRTTAALALVLIALPILLFSSGRSGNVQPLLVAGLVLGLERRWGPLAIAIAASLKAFPLALSLVYLGRGDWRRFTISLSLTAILVAPMLLFDLSRYTVDGPRAGTLFQAAPILWGVVVAAAAGITILLAQRRSAYAWLAGAATVVLGLPRTLSYDTTFLLAGSPVKGRGTRNPERDDLTSRRSQ
ncbi:MAG: glycosyltransferase 87 family protein [Chloroflexota bacterium]|nr:glycosyltransferase 87 family protein [Chloroflexota bacterium]